MKVHKLDIHEFIDDDFDLIAINSSMEDYMLVFEINKKLKLELSRVKKDIVSVIDSEEVSFSRFAFEDEKRDLYWSVIQNIKWIPSRDSSILLFDEPEEKVYLLPEFKNFDFFLKIDGLQVEELSLIGLLDDLKSINKVSGVFYIDPDKIKSKNNLIF